MNIWIHLCVCDGLVEWTGWYTESAGIPVLLDQVDHMTYATVGETKL